MSNRLQGSHSHKDKLIRMISKINVPLLINFEWILFRSFVCNCTKILNAENTLKFSSMKTKPEKLQDNTFWVLELKKKL